MSENNWLIMVIQKKKKKKKLIMEGLNIIPSWQLAGTTSCTNQKRQHSDFTGKVCGYVHGGLLIKSWFVPSLSFAICHKNKGQGCTASEWTVMSTTVWCKSCSSWTTISTHYENNHIKSNTQTNFPSILNSLHEILPQKETNITTHRSRILQRFPQSSLYTSKL